MLTIRLWNSGSEKPYDLNFAAFSSFPTKTEASPSVNSRVLHDLGYAETNLGPNLPLDVLTDCVGDEHPALVWLSINEPPRSRTQLSEIAKLAEACESLGTRLVVGGRHGGDLQQSWGSQPTPWEQCTSMLDLETIAKKRLASLHP